MKIKDLWMCRFTNRKLIRFIIAGAICTILDFVIYYVLSIKIKITYAKLISTTVAAVFSLIINKNWTFEYGNRIDIMLLLRYLLCQCMNITINVTINTMVYYVTQLKVVSFIVATGIATIVNYILQKVFVFNEKYE